MATNSVGTLFIDIQARTAKLEADMSKVKGIVDAAGDSIAKSGDKGGAGFSAGIQRGMLGAMLFRQVVRELVKEVGYVIENIEKIPNVPGETIVSVQDLRSALKDAKDGFDGLIASGLGFISTAGKTLGVMAADVFTQDGSGDLPLVDRTPDQQAKDKDPKFDDEVAESAKKLSAARRELRDVTQDLASKVNMLRTEEAAERAYQKNKNNNTLETTDSTLRYTQDEIKEKTALLGLDKKLAEADTKNASAKAAGQEKTKPLFTQIRDYQSQIKSLQDQINNTILYPVDPKSGQMKQDPVAVKELADLTDQQTKKQLALNEAMKKYGDLWTELGTSMADDLVQGIEKGENMHTILLKLIEDVVKLIIQQEVEKPLASMLTTGVGAIGTAAMALFASGGPYVANQPFIAGENGPEIINPGGQSGSVVNAGDTAASLGGGGGGDQNITVNQHFAAGVTQAQLMGMAPIITQKAISGVLDAVRRGGAMRYAIMQGT